MLAPPVPNCGRPGRPVVRVVPDRDVVDLGVVPEQVGDEQQYWRCGRPSCRGAVGGLPYTLTTTRIPYESSRSLSARLVRRPGPASARDSTASVIRIERRPSVRATVAVCCELPQRSASSSAPTKKSAGRRGGRNVAGSADRAVKRERQQPSAETRHSFSYRHDSCEVKGLQNPPSGPCDPVQCGRKRRTPDAG